MQLYLCETAFSWENGSIWYNIADFYSNEKNSTTNGIDYRFIYAQNNIFNIRNNEPVGP